eukprot:scaffold149_cov315-Pinguiococcus_pyrenoidosus.AAC.141
MQRIAQCCSICAKLVLDLPLALLCVFLVARRLFHGVNRAPISFGTLPVVLALVLLQRRPCRAVGRPETQRFAIRLAFRFCRKQSSKPSRCVINVRADFAHLHRGLRHLGACLVVDSLGELMSTGHELRRGGQVPRVLEGLGRGDQELRPPAQVSVLGGLQLLGHLLQFHHHMLHGLRPQKGPNQVPKVHAGIVHQEPVAVLGSGVVEGNQNAAEHLPRVL